MRWISGPLAELGYHRMIADTEAVRTRALEATLHPRRPDKAPLSANRMPVATLTVHAKRDRDR
jgi:hypothetical protein